MKAFLLSSSTLFRLLRNPARIPSRAYALGRFVSRTPKRNVLRRSTSNHPLTSAAQSSSVNPSASTSDTASDTPSLPSSLSQSAQDEINNAFIPSITNDVAASTNLRHCMSIIGNEHQMVTVKLRPGQVIRAESGSFIYATEGVKMEASLSGLSATVQRYLTGQNLFITDFTNTKQPTGATTIEQEQVAEVGLGPNSPAKMLQFNLSDHPGKRLICSRGAFLCGDPTISIRMKFVSNLTAGLFGGSGFILQELEGEGTAIVKSGGALIKRQLGAGEVLRVSPGNMLAMESTVNYDVERLQGLKNMLFSGEFIYILTLTGPGTVWLKSLPFSNMCGAIANEIGANGPGVGIGVPLALPFGGGGQPPATLDNSVIAGGIGSSIATGAAMGVGSEAMHRAFAGGSTSSVSPPSPQGSTDQYSSIEPPPATPHASFPVEEPHDSMVDDYVPEDEEPTDGFFSRWFGDDDDASDNDD